MHKSWTADGFIQDDEQYFEIHIMFLMLIQEFCFIFERCRINILCWRGTGCSDILFLCLIHQTLKLRCSTFASAQLHQQNHCVLVTVGQHPTTAFITFLKLDLSINEIALIYSELLRCVCTPLALSVSAIPDLVLIKLVSRASSRSENGSCNLHSAH